MSAFFSEQELYYIREHSTWPAEEIAKTLNKTVPDVVLARNTLGLPTYTKRDWSDEEVRFVKDNYGKLSVPEMVPLLHRTRASIQRKIATLGLCNGKPSATQVLKKWTKEENKYIRKHRDDDINDIAKALGRSVSATRSQMNKLKVRKPSRKKWKKKEIAYLYEHGYTDSYEDISKVINRSVFSIKSKAQELGIFKYQAFVSLGNLERAFGTDSVYIRKSWIEKYGLPAEKHIIGKQVMYDIDPETFWECVPQHLDIVPIRRYVEGSIIPEPNNLKSLIFSAPKKAPNSRKPFSMNEKKQILDDYEKGKSLKQLADQHGRSVVSIQHIVFPNREERERNSFLYEQHRK